MTNSTVRRRWTRRGVAVLLPAALAVVLQPVLVPAQQQPPTTGPAGGGAAPATRPAGVVPPPTTRLAPDVSPAPSVMIPATTTRPATTRIVFNFKNAPVDTVLEHLSAAAGFVIIKESPVDGLVTIIAAQPLTPTEAVSELNSVLKPNGYTIIRQGRTLKVTTIDKALHGDIPVRFGNDPEQIPETDDLITQIVPVRSVDAVKLKTDLQPLINSTALLASNGGSNSIIITDSSANIHRVVEIIASLDKKDALESGIRVRHLLYADATASAKLISDLFKPADQTTGGNGGGGFNPARFFGGGGFGGGGRGGGGGGGGPGGGGGGQAAEADDKGKTGTVLAEADTRTNTVVITGPTDTLTIIDGVLDKIDANPVMDQTFFIYKVKNGQAVDMQATLATLFQSTVGTSSSGSRTTSSTNRLGSSGSSSSFGSSSGSGSSSFGSSSGSSSSRSGTSGTSGTSSTSNNNRQGQGGSGSGSGSGGTSTQNTIAAALSGQVEVVADTDTNQLLVATATKYEADVRKIIAELDRPVPQVLIKVLVAEVTHDRSDDLGADFSVLNLRASGLGSTVGSNFGNGLAETTSGGVNVAILENRISATIHALATAGKLDVLSRPYILTSDNQEAYVLVGQEVPIITNSQVTEAGQLINSVKYQDIGVSLDVTPHVNPDGLVVMDVSPQISSISDQSITVQAGVTNPVFNQREAESHVAIKDGETIVIGGLMQDQKTQSISKIPILGDIPYLGLIFQRDTVTKTKTELLIFLTPHVALVPDKLQAMSNDEVRGLQLTPNAVQPGTFPYHMQGMRRGGSATQPVLPIPAVPKDRDSWEPEPKLP